VAAVCDDLGFLDLAVPELGPRDAPLEEQRTARVVARVKLYRTASVPEGERVGLVVGLLVRRRVQLEHDVAGREHERMRRVDRLLERQRPFRCALRDELRQGVEPRGLVTPRAGESGR
jgi:hypothetical protein